VNWKAIAIAAGVGAVGFYLLRRNLSGLALGAGVGALTQVGVRLAGAS
jgi:hypothetical protein